MISFYTLKDQVAVPCTFEEWGNMMHKPEKIVGRTRIDKHTEVSTVFLGLPHGGLYDEPLLFETMVFTNDAGGDMWRFATWKEAEDFHNKKVEELKGNK